MHIVYFGKVQGHESSNIPERRCHLFQRADIPINDDYILFIYYALFAMPTLSAYELSPFTL